MLTGGSPVPPQVVVAFFFPTGWTPHYFVDGFRPLHGPHFLPNLFHSFLFGENLKSLGGLSCVSIVRPYGLTDPPWAGGLNPRAKFAKFPVRDASLFPGYDRVTSSSP